MHSTLTDRIAGAYTVSLKGEYLETIIVRPSAPDDDDDTTPRYDVDSYDDQRSYLDTDEARSAVADIARTLRAERLEQLTDAAVDAVTALLDDGRALEVARVLRAAGLL